MKSTRCILSIILGLLAGWLPLGAVTVLKNLQVEYQTNPLGIDVSQPRFNWQMESDRYGACGQAYRLWVADSPEQLAAGRYIYDSGKVLSGESVGVVYQGKALQPSTRYYWKVSVWDESGTEITSTEPAWFETGLLGSGWSGARWIGSSETQLSKYRSHYVIDYDVRVAEGNDKAAFVFGARDADNYVSAELDLNGSGDARFILRHTTDGKTTQDASESLASIIPASDKHKAHHIRLKVTTAQYALKYFVDIEIDGKTLVNSSLTPEEKERKSRGDFWGGKEGAFTVYPYPDGELDTYDITDLLRPGDNGIGAILGAGWWSEHSGFLTGWQDQYGTRQSLLGKIVIEYADGTRETIVTNDSWKCYDRGPITFNGLQNGEEYDARKEVNGWDAPGFDDSSWKPATLFAAPPVNVEIQGYVGSPIQNNVTLTAQSMVEPIPGVYVYDMGQNMVGVPRLTFKGKAGQEITIRFGEMNYPETIPTEPVAPYTIAMYKEKKGQVYTDNYRSALSTDRYILRGDAAGETYEPRFTFHGFRYVEIHGLERPLPLEAVKGIVLESIGARTSGYETSDERVNRLFSNIIWGQRGNFLSVPTDCPQRDERMGWTGDAQVFARTATYNMNVDPFYTRWLYSVRDNQGDDGSYANYIPVVGFPPHGAEDGGGAMGWMEAGVIVPWQMYQQYGDVRILEQHYASMVAYMDYLERRAVRYVQPFGGFGDWLAIEPTNSMLTNTAYSAYDALIMEQVAKRLGKDADQRRFRTFYENVKRSFNDLFVNEEGRTFAPTVESIFGKDSQVGMWPGTAATEAKIVDTQTSYVVPLQFDLFNEKNKPLAIRHLVENIKKHNYTLTTGFIGTPYLNLVLSDNGYDDVAYKLFEQTAYPSWLYPVLQGATTIWERWNSYTLVNGFGPVDMNSFNHYSYGAIEEWMIAYTLGIQRDEEQPAYKHIILQPRIGGTFSFIRGHYDSAYGRIESGWQIQKKGYIYEATIPANTTATLYLPAKSEKSVRMEKGQEGITPVGLKDGKAVYRLGSGSYRIYVD